MKCDIKFILNYKTIEISVDPLKRLIDVLREDLNLTGVKEGCGKGECGACAVLVDGMIINSCMYPAGKLDGKEVITIDGFKNTLKFEILRDSFEEAGAVQCGFCTPGMIIAAESLLRRCSHPTEDKIREGISGNICRCTGYNMIVDAVKIAAKRGEGLW